MPRPSDADFAAIRDGLKELPRTPHYSPGDDLEPNDVLVVRNHRSVLDPDRALVIGNRGVGKSFWAHALASPATRTHIAKSFKELSAVDVEIGFNASPRVSPIAPTLAMLGQAAAAGLSPDAVWRCVLVRAALQGGVPHPKAFPEAFASQVSWTADNGEAVDKIVTELDDLQVQKKRKLVLVFDALDRLGDDWESKRTQLMALLQQALSARSYRAIRLKLFLRVDQFEDPRLFAFSDGSKIRNERVDLQWTSNELYTLLFWYLERQASSSKAFKSIQKSVATPPYDTDAAHIKIVNVIAGEFMGNSHKRGRVFTWLPLHLADARGETSPRTFLTAWREASLYEPAPSRPALDHRGIQEGVRKASEDRMRELEEDYWWISLALRPLRDHHVPMGRAQVSKLWSSAETARQIIEQSEDRLPPVALDAASRSHGNLEGALLADLQSIGIIEVRPSDKINVPDIFRLEAGIKRKGGVAAPKRAQRQ